MTENIKSLIKVTWQKVSLAILKSFRGLICEKKDGGWELSTGRISFWIVFSHCMYIWNKVGDTVKEIMEPAKDVVTETATAVADAPVITEKIVEMAELTIKYSDVSQSELYVLFALLTYAGVKVGSDMIKGFATAWKNNK